MKTGFITYASTMHIENGIIAYYREYLGFEEHYTEDDATIFETFEEAEQAKEKIEDTFVGRIFVKDIVDGEEIEVFRNI